MRCTGGWITVLTMKGFIKFVEYAHETPSLSVANSFPIRWLLLHFKIGNSKCKESFALALGYADQESHLGI